jgi:hypothetical protein
MADSEVLTGLNERSMGMKARDVIEPGETAVAIFTSGRRFKLNQDGSGSTGNWVISQRRKTDKVIIYKQDAERGQHEIYVGLLIEIIDSDEQGRREVRMANLELVGTTTNNWNEFTETQVGAVNPIKYIK